MTSIVVASNPEFGIARINLAEAEWAFLRLSRDAARVRSSIAVRTSESAKPATACVPCSISLNNTALSLICFSASLHSLNTLVYCCSIIRLLMIVLIRVDSASRTYFVHMIFCALTISCSLPHGGGAAPPYHLCDSMSAVWELVARG